MARVEIVCLANSWKHGARCIAGVRLDGGGWIRPVAQTEQGELRREHYELRDGTEPRVLDVLAIRVKTHTPELHQPENWLISDRKWRRVQPADGPDLGPLLEAHLHDGTPLFGTRGDRIPWNEIESSPPEYSLALIAPTRLQWDVRHKYGGGLQARGTFEWGDALYDLPVTDPILHARLVASGLGLCTVEEAGLDPARMTYMTISLGEPTSFDQCCYKLIAAAFQIHE